MTHSRASEQIKTGQASEDREDPRLADTGELRRLREVYRSSAGHLSTEQIGSASHACPCHSFHQLLHEGFQALTVGPKVKSKEGIE